MHSCTEGDSLHTLTGSDEAQCTNFKRGELVPLCRRLRAKKKATLLEFFALRSNESGKKNDMKS